MLAPVADPSDGGDPEQPHKLRIYSAHDTTIVAFLVAIDQFNFVPPPYASALIFEVYDDNSIELKYRNNTTQEPVQLKLCKNDGTCSFDQWVTDTANLIASDWASECGIKPPQNHQGNYLVLLTLLLATWF